MTFQRLLLAMTFLAFGLLHGWSQKILTWDSPTTEYGNVYFDGFFDIAMDITKVELKPDETTVYATVRQRSDYSHLGLFQFSKGTCLLADGKRYPVVSAEGIEFDKLRQTENGRLDIVFHFEPLPQTTQSFDFMESEDGFQIKGIKPVEERWKELFPSYWRDDRTGEWVIAFLENHAIYDNKIWDMQAEVSSRTGKAEMTLTCGDEQLSVLVGKNRKGRRSIRIGEQKHTLSMITGRFMPDYPQKDTRTDFVDTGYEADTVTFMGWLKDMPESLKAQKDFVISYDDFVTDETVQYNARLDSLGRFSIQIPLTNSSYVSFDWDRCAIRFPLEPGKTYFLLYDFKEGRRFLMGDDVRLQNELLKYPLEWFGLRMEDGDDLNEFLNATDSIIKAKHASIDSLCIQNPTLSARFCQFSKENITSEAAFCLGQARFCLPEFILPEHANRYAYEHFWKKMSKPYMLHRDWRDFIRDYVNGIVSANKNTAYYYFNTFDFIEDFASNAEELDFLKKVKSKSEEMNARFDAVQDEEEKQRLVEQFYKENEAMFKRSEAILYSPKAQEIIGNKIFLVDMSLNIHVLDSLGADSLIKTAVLYEGAYKKIDHTRKPLSQEIMDSLAVWTGNAPVLQRIREKNDYYVALANRQIGKLVLKTGSEVEGLQEGAEILRKLTEPYRGKYILLDVWGTWCGPCKEALSHSQEEYDRLAKYDLQYMYLANNSPKDTWENVIKEYNVAGDNVVHFNLPKEQQKAIEMYLKVSSFPTYKVIDPEGRVLDVRVDPRNLNATEELFKLLTGK